MRQEFVSFAAFCLLIVAPAINAQTEGTYFAVIVSNVDASTDWYESTFGLAVGSRLSESGHSQAHPAWR